MEKQVYVLYAPETFQDGLDVVEAIGDKASHGNNLSFYFHQPYLPHKNYIIGFTNCLSGGYMSNSEINWYKRIVLTKEAFIFYMLNTNWNTFLNIELNRENVFKWLKENMPIQYCNKCEFKIIKYFNRENKCI